MNELSVTPERANDTIQASPRINTVAPALLLAAFVLVNNVNALFADFVWDDRALIIGNTFIRHWNTLPELFRHPFLGLYYRPVVMLSFGLEYALWGLNPSGFHLTNVLLHAANTILVFLFLREISGSKGIALVAALLFASHPAHKGIIVIADRTGMLSAFFFLSSLLLYVRYRRSASRGNALICYAASLLLCGLAFFSKEEVIALPLLIVLIDLLVPGKGENLSRTARIAGYAPFFALAVAYVWIRARVLGAAAGIVSAFMIEPARRLITIPAVLVDYCMLLLFPFNLDYEPRAPLALSIAELRILLPLLLMIVIAAMIPRLARKAKLLAFGLLWYLIVFIPMSNIVPIYPEAADAELFTPIHFLYLPSIGVFLCAALGFERVFRGPGENRFARQRRLATASLCCVLVMFSLLSIKRNFIWRDELRLFRYIVRMHPENHRMRLNLGNVYLERKQADEAVSELKQAVLLAPDVANYRIGLALAYKAKGWLDRAIDESHEAMRLDPDSAAPYRTLASIYKQQGKLPEAVAAARKATELAPSSAAAHVNLALILRDAGNLAEAEKHFETAIRSAPDSAEAHNGLGTVHAVRGHYDLARKEWEMALRLRPDMVEARENLQKLERMGH